MTALRNRPVVVSAGYAERRRDIPETTYRGMLRELAPETADRGLDRVTAHWHFTSDDAATRRIRVVVNVWNGTDVLTQLGGTVETIREAWRVAAAIGAVHPTKRTDPAAFKAWVTLGRVGR